jgi:hypothetical protein
VAELTRTETFALTAIAYLQPVTRGEISKLAGRQISRDVIAALKRHGLIDGAIRAPQPGAPFAYVTTKTFLEAFGLPRCAICPTSNGLKLKADCKEDRGRLISTAPSGWRSRATRTGTCLRGRVKTSTRARICERVSRGNARCPRVHLDSLLGQTGSRADALVEPVKLFEPHPARLGR